MPDLNNVYLQYLILGIFLFGMWIWLRLLKYIPTNPMQAQAIALPGLLVALVVGGLGLSSIPALGLPTIWSAQASFAQKTLIPIALGVGFGLWGILNSRINQNNTGDTTAETSFAPLPAAIPLYILGNAQTELFLRLGLLSLLLALGNWLIPQLPWLPVALMVVLELVLVVVSFRAGGGSQPPAAMLLSLIYFGVLSLVLSLQMITIGFIAPLLIRIFLGVVAEIVVPLINRKRALSAINRQTY
jgi:hypothetical protein